MTLSSILSFKIILAEPEDVKESIIIDLCLHSKSEIQAMDFRGKHIIKSQPYDPDCYEKSKNFAQGKDLSGANLSGFDLKDSGIENASDLSKINFTKVTNLPRNTFKEKNIFGSNLTGIDLSGSGIEKAFNLVDVNFSEVTNLPYNVFNDKNLQGVNLTKVNLVGTGIQKATNLEYVNFTGVTNLPTRVFAGKSLVGANLSGLRLVWTGIESATNLSFVNFTGVTNLPYNIFKGKNLMGANLTDLDLQWSGIEHATQLKGINFTGVTNLPYNIFKGKNIERCNLTGLDLAYSGIKEATDLSGVNFTGVINLPPDTFNGKNLEGAILTGTDLALTGIENATNISDIVLRDNFSFSRPLIFSNEEMEIITTKYPWNLNNGITGKYLGIDFNKDQFIKLLTITNLISNKFQNKMFGSLLADTYFKNILKKNNNDSNKFLEIINEINDKNLSIESDLFLSEQNLKSILKETSCYKLIPDDFKIDSHSPAEIYLKEQFDFKDANDFLIEFIDLCSKKCPSIEDSRKEINQNRSLLQMASKSPKSYFEVDNSKEKIIESVDDFLALIKEQKKENLKGTIIKYKNQSGQDAGGLRRDFYDKILEIFKDPEQRQYLKNYNDHTLGRILAMQVGVEKDIPGFNLDLDEKFYQGLIDSSSKYEKKENFKNKIQDFLCSEKEGEKEKIKNILFTLVHPEQVDEDFFECEKNVGLMSTEETLIKFNEMFKDLFEFINKSTSTKILIKDKNPDDNDFVDGFFSIIDKTKIIEMMPITALDLKKFIEGDPTPDGKEFLSKFFDPDGYTYDEIEKLKEVLIKYFNKNGSDSYQQKIQVAKLLKFTTGSTQIKGDKKVIFRKYGTSMFKASTCSLQAGCSDEILAKTVDDIVKILDVSIEYGIATGMELD